MPDLLPDEHLEPLGGGLRLVVSKAHIFSTDSLLLAHFSAIRKTDAACDLGTGSGIVPLLWCKGESGPITAVDIQENRFGFEPEITAKISRMPGVRVKEVPISYYPRTNEEGKKIGFKDGLRAIYCIWKYRKG